MIITNIYFQLVFHAVQPIIQCPKTVWLKQGEIGIISCKVTGEPDPN